MRWILRDLRPRDSENKTVFPETQFQNMRRTVIWCCFCVLFWIIPAFLKSCPLKERNHCCHALWNFQRSLWAVGSPSPASELSLCYTGVGFGFREALKHGLHPASPCLAGSSSFNIDKQVFATSHGVNVTEVSSCQYDILQNQNKTKHNLTIGNVKLWWLYIDF